MLTWCCERVQVWWKVEDPYVGTIEWKASIMKEGIANHIRTHPEL